MSRTQKAVRLRKNVKISDKWRWCPLATDSKGRLVGDIVLIKGRRETHREGRFAIFWKEGGKNRSEPAGVDFTEARSALRRRQARLNAQMAGVVIPAEHARGSRTTLEDGADDFLAEIKTQRERKTFLAYRSMLRDFLASCAKAHLDEIERPDLIEFVAYLKTKERGKNSKRLSDRTIYNKFELLMTFLKASGIRGLVTKRDWPKYTEQEVEVYEREELTALFEHCTERERVLFLFFLSSAGRDREVIFTAWPNLDLKNSLWHVKAKPTLGFKPKDYEERTVPLPDSIVEELKKWRKGAGNTFLVFPGPDGKPDAHMLRTLKQLALDAGLNCGHCRNTKGLSCRKHPVCDRWYLHKFRATTATNWLQNDVDIKTVQAWLGHSDMEFDAESEPARNKFFPHSRVFFGAFLHANSAAQSKLSAAYRAQPHPYPDAVQVSTETFAVAFQSSNRAAHPAAFTSQARARDYIAKAVAADPSLSGKLHVLPQFEVAA